MHVLTRSCKNDWKDPEKAYCEIFKVLARFFKEEHKNAASSQKDSGYFENRKTKQDLILIYFAIHWSWFILQVIERNVTVSVTLIWNNYSYGESMRLIVIVNETVYGTVNETVTVSVIVLVSVIKPWILPISKCHAHVYCSSSWIVSRSRNHCV